MLGRIPNVGAHRQRKEIRAVSKDNWPLPEPTGTSGHALYQFGHSNPIEESRSIWGADTNGTPLHMSVDVEPGHFVMAWLARPGSPRPRAWRAVMLLLISGSQLV